MLSSGAPSSYPSPAAAYGYGRHLASVKPTKAMSSIGRANVTGASSVDGVGDLTYQRAIDIARNTEGDLDPNVSQYLEKALEDIWSRVNSQPESYVLSKDEFAVFNFYVQRFEGAPVAQQAIDRYWRNASDPSTSRS